MKKMELLNELKNKLTYIKDGELVKLNQYVNENGLCIYLDSNKSKIFHFGKYKCNFVKTNEYKVVYANDQEYIDRMNQINNGLYKIDDNIEVINNILTEVIPFTLYEYYESKDGKFYVLNWTDNYNSMFLTGNKMLCYPLFYGYKLDNNSCVKSDYVEDLDEIKDEYGYIKRDFYNYVNYEYQNDLDDENVTKLTKTKK